MIQIEDEKNPDEEGFFINDDICTLTKPKRFSQIRMKNDGKCQLKVYIDKSSVLTITAEVVE